MRIALIGTSGVGKTTLANALVDILKCDHITERSRAIIKKLGLNSPSEIKDEETMKSFQKAILYSQSTEELYSDNFISDRAYVDFTSYARLFISDKEWLKDYDNLCREIQKAAKYDIVFYIPPVIPEVDDGVRYLGDIRIKADLEMLETLKRWNVSYVAVSPLSVSDRVEFCLEKILKVSSSRQDL